MQILPVLLVMSFIVENTMLATENEKTLETYEKSVQAYVEGTANVTTGYYKEWIDQVLSALNSRARIFEIGSGFGRDAAYIASCGYTIECSDAVPGFIEILQERGLPVRSFNVLTDEFNSKYDCIFAAAVLLHFAPEQLHVILEKTYAGLNSGGILACTVKEGTGSEWSNAKVGAPRYFCYWQPENLQKVLEAAKFSITSLVSMDGWIYIIAKKEN